ncbi:MAG TPA: hydrogenase maturation nickel metallochaperone HypA [Solirubrobacteraceae bacterium]|nr:hydrogenase maturation nickel metallochaperone HypA [Solirubrobacteraceae bacterium]
MHELAIADRIVAIARDHAAGRRVTRVEVKVGHLRQVVPDSLRFSFELVAHGTPVEGAELVMEEVPAAGACRQCGQESELAGFPLACPACGSLDLELLRGEELLVDSLELEEEETLATSGGSP